MRVVGLGLVVAALLDGGVSSPARDPVLKTFGRQALAAAAGIGLIVCSTTSNTFRAKEIQIRALGNYHGRCPGTHRRARWEPKPPTRDRRSFVPPTPAGLTAHRSG
jgi:hypothetical protein